MQLCLLKVLRLPKDGALSALSGALSAKLMRRRGRSRLVLGAGNHLQGAVVLTPLYRCGPRPRWEATPDARLSLICCLAVWRAGGVVAPVTPTLLAPPKDPLGLEPNPQNWVQELPAVLSAWRPDVVLSFGALDALLTRMHWAGGATDLLRPSLQLKRLAPQPPEGEKEEAMLDSERVAVELASGVRLSFAELLGAVLDPAGAPPAKTEEGALVELLRAAGSSPAAKAERQAGRGEPWWSADGPFREGAWPPKKLQRGPPEWRSLLDHYSGQTYFWHEERNETTWEVPGGGRLSGPAARSRLRSYAVALAEALQQSRKFRVETRRRGGRGRRGSAPAAAAAAGDVEEERMGAAGGGGRGPRVHHGDWSEEALGRRGRLSGKASAAEAAAGGELRYVVELYGAFGGPPPARVVDRGGGEAREALPPP